MRPNQVRLLTGSLLAAAALASLVIPSRTRAANEPGPDWSKISFKVTKLTDALYFIEGVGGFSGGNIAVAVGPEGTLLVDSSFPALTKKLEAEIAKLSKKPLRYVINTHFHGDHTAGNLELGKKATIIAHDNTRARLIAEGFRSEEPAAPVSWPVITVNDGFTMYFNGDEVQARHPASAHTDSDLIVTFKKANVVHLGDLFFNGMYPFIDLDHGGSVRGYVATLEKVLAELPPDAKLIGGHGPPGGKKELEAYVGMIKECVALVEAGLAEKKSLGSMIHGKLLAKYDATWGHGLITGEEFLTHLYRGLVNPAAK